MNRLADRKNQRRQALRRKAKAEYKAEAQFYLPFLVVGLMGLIGGKVLIAITREHTALTVFSLIGFILLLLLVSFPWVMRTIHRAAKLGLEAESIPLEPLSASEVLVRGAEAPSATRDTLLRPAIDSTQTPAEQLLRATNVAGSEQR